MKKILIIVAVLAVVTVMLAGCGNAKENETANSEMPDSYQSSLTDRVGAMVSVCFEDDWTDQVSNGRAIADCSKEMQGLSIDMVNNDDGKIVYQAHETGGEWLNEQSNGKELSSDGSINAVKVKLDDQSSETYDVYTKVFQNNKWSEWALNGKAVGDKGGAPITGICVGICDKTEGEPDFRIRDMDSNQKMIALTFDDSPSDKETDVLLDILKENDACATFFVIGESVNEDRADAMNRIVDEGSEMGIHTYSHDMLTEISTEEVASTCARCSWVIENTTGLRPVLMRSPGGNCNADALNVLQTMELPNVLWSVDSEDWKDQDSKSTADAILKDVAEGSIILAHDTKASTVEAMKTVIPELASQGYQFMTVSELFAYNGGICAGKQYSQLGEADDPAAAEEGFSDVFVLENEDGKVAFCGADLDGSDKSITLNICCDNFSDKIRKFKIKNLEINGEACGTDEILGSVNKGGTKVFEYVIKDEAGHDYSEISDIRFAIEICDKNNKALSKSQTVHVTVDTENETFSATAE